ncbi:MAG: NAD(P)-dependent alcohol dehydrogenase [Bacteroidetes bacterium]|jgi:NADPH:quinone reductase-like Zn-dependent oxidoreductase|nr:NAD(P)-dependent alcohol dehydrogenase [Bacteroidota bacterium]
MKAIVYRSYGPPEVLRYEEVEKPTPAENEVLIRVRAASVNPIDWHLMRGAPFVIRLMFGGLRKPKGTRLGRDVSGQAEAVGKQVTQFKPGDDVFGACQGTFAEYVCAREDRLALKPANISFEHAAAVPVAAITALQGLRNKGRIQRGQKVLVDGASGGVGTFAVQIARSFGAEVTAVCSTSKMETARAIGADHVIDYTRTDFTRTGKRYDLILGANAYHSIIDYWCALNPRGVYVGTGGGGGESIPAILLEMLAQWLRSLIGGKTMSTMMANINKADLDVLKELLEKGQMVPIIDRRYALRESADALRYLEDGHARGKVVIVVNDPA